MEITTSAKRPAANNARRKTVRRMITRPGGALDSEIIAAVNETAGRMKNGKPHVIPLAPPALDILRRRQRNGRDYVFGSGQGGFQGWSQARKALDSRMGGDRATWTLHDFRRMASTTMNGPLKVQPHVVERVLAHVQRGVSATYNKWEYADEKKAALALWAEYVTTVVSSQPEVVVQLAST